MSKGVNYMFKHALRALVAAGVVTIVAPFSTGTAGAGTTVSYQHIALVSCSSVRLVRPSRYTLGCGNGTYILSHVKWKTWGGARADATAIYTLNTCSPTCAAGTHYSYNAEVIAEGARKVTSGYVYKKLLLIYTNHGQPARVLWTLPPS